MIKFYVFKFTGFFMMTNEYFSVGSLSNHLPKKILGVDTPNSEILGV